MSKLKLVFGNKEERLYEYIPELTHLLYIDFEPMRFIRRIRYLLEFLHEGKYKVYYLSIDDELVGHCVVTPGGRRLKCSTNRDIVLGPYYIKEEQRGKGYSERLISLVLEHCSYSYENAYDWIEKGNTASRRASEYCGFKPVAELNVTLPFRRLVIVDQGEDIVYRYEK